MEIDNQLANNFTFTKNKELIFMDDDRHIFISISAFGELRKDLIDNLGIKRMKGFLFRYGWELGRTDGKKVKKKNIHCIEEMIEYGPMLHSMKGHVIARSTKIEIDKSQEYPFISMEGTWKSSYEAAEHTRLFGQSDHPVCYTLVGYASGYISELFKKVVIFKEIACEGKGDAECRWIGKPIDGWGPEIENELMHFKETPIVQELEETYEKLLSERNNLAQTAKIHKKLTEEIIQGNDLQSIANVVYETMEIPILIEDAHFRPLASSGLVDHDYHIVSQSLQFYLEKKNFSSFLENDQTYRPFTKTKMIETPDLKRLITPVFLQGKIYGYCSFLFFTSTKLCTDIAYMIIERVSSICSIYLLNEKSKFEAAERVKGHFLEELIGGHYRSKKEVLKRGNYLHLDLAKPYYIVVIRYHIAQYHLQNDIAFHEGLLEEISHYFKKEKLNLLLGQRSNSLFFLVQTELLKGQAIESFCEEIVDYLTAFFPQTSFQIGISMKGEKIDHAPRHYKEALTAVRMTMPTKAIATFESLGIVGSLINDNNKEAVLQMAQYTLGSLYQPIDERKQDLLKTLYFFLANGGNLELTAADLSLSISGLRYRIRKMEKTIGRELRNPVVNYQLFLSLQALMLTGELNLEQPSI